MDSSCPGCSLSCRWGDDVGHRQTRRALGRASFRRDISGFGAAATPAGGPPASACRERALRSYPSDAASTSGFSGRHLPGALMRHGLFENYADHTVGSRRDESLRARSCCAARRHAPTASTSRHRRITEAAGFVAPAFRPSLKLRRTTVALAEVVRPPSRLRRRSDVTMDLIPVPPWIWVLAALLFVLGVVVLWRVASRGE
jgi:hypothetical protein